MKVQAELDETKGVLHKTIESVLERGEKLDSLVERSDALSAQSKLFYRSAKKQVISHEVILIIELVLCCYVVVALRDLGPDGGVVYQCRIPFGYRVEK
jgi:hypothetical protein